MKTKLTERPCIDCKVSMEYIPRRVRCVECYKNKRQDESKKKINFIDDYSESTETNGGSLK
jgi:hypothetical protein